MPTLTKQILLKVSPELDELIDQAFSKHLKETGEYISRSDYIRRLLGFSISLSKDDVLIIYGLLNDAARKEKAAGNEIGAKGLQDKADKFKACWISMPNNKE